LYLERAKQALLEIGATYTPSQAEAKTLLFWESIDHISKVKFVKGGFFPGMSFKPCHYTIIGECSDVLSTGKNKRRRNKGFQKSIEYDRI